MYLRQRAYFVCAFGMRLSHILHSWIVNWYTDSVRQIRTHYNYLTFDDYYSGI